MIKKIALTFSILVMCLAWVNNSYCADEARIKEAYQQMMNAYSAYTSAGNPFLSNNYDSAKSDQLLREYVAAADRYKALLKESGKDGSTEVFVNDPKMSQDDYAMYEANENSLRSYVRLVDAQKNNASAEEIQKLKDEYANCQKIIEELFVEKANQETARQLIKGYETTGKILNCRPVVWDREIANKYHNICGQYAVNATLNYLGIKEDYKTTIENMNPVNSLTAPDHIISYLESKNVECQPKNEADIEDLKKSVDAGHLALCYVSNSSFEYPHWVTVIGYDKNEAGEITHVIYLDGDYPVHRKVGIFKDEWLRPSYVRGRINELLNHNYYMIEVKGVNPNLKSGRNYTNTAMDDQFLNGVNTMALGMNQSVDAFTAVIKRGDFNSLSKIDLSKINYPVLALGAVETITAVPNKLTFGLSGLGMKKAGTALQNYGNSRPVTGDFVSDAVTGTAKTAGSVLKTGGNCVTTIGNYISKAEEIFFIGAKKMLNFNW